MSTRLSAVGRLLSLVKRTGVQNTFLRRNLVPSRFSGPKAISVIYRVEDVPGFTPGEGNFTEAFITFFQRFSKSRTMLSSQEQVTTIISPPEAVRGMKMLERNLFTGTITIPGIKVPAREISSVSKILKKSLFKMQRVKPIAELAKDDPQFTSHKLFLLDPKKFKTGSDVPLEDAQKLAEFGVDVKEMACFDLEVGYENWNAAEVLRAVLPEESESVSSYSIIGHIAHLNLKPEVMDYKHVIGQVILDKNPSVATVVNKLNTIDNTFRNFQMELLAGEDNFVTCARENCCTFEMDFSKVYWNPRLSTEHQRVVDLLNKDDILYDVFAGVGPFAIPAAKKGAKVYANDLNPNSHDALVKNVKHNKIKPDRLQAYNMDGREFILTVLKPDLVTRLKARAEMLLCESGDLEDQNLNKTDSCIGDATDTVQKSRDGRDSELEGNVKEPETQPGCRSNDQDKSSQGTCKGFAVNTSPPGIADTPKIYITMNLPALALEFLDTYSGLLSDFPAELQSDPRVVEGLPTVLCYCFSKSEDAESDVRDRAETIMGCALPTDSSVRMVRNVAPNKEMMCVVFRLTPEVVFSAASQSKGSEGESTTEVLDDQPLTKKRRVSESL